MAQVSLEVAGTEAYRIGDVTEIKKEWLLGKKKVAVTAGASTPTPITREVIQYLEKFDENDQSTWETVRTVNMSKILPSVKA